ncbi:putative DUF21 domain-containing protein At3g13070, chloroplastic, partial [Neltuma alba]|uniref:putative DUF21 domain-containing protein At3g13070, chloroplastic n=1 Tax=Neltuma alba TaxID=207710 RepID=UPI0010A2C7CC
MITLRSLASVRSPCPVLDRRCRFWLFHYRLPALASISCLANNLNPSLPPFLIFELRTLSVRALFLRYNSTVFLMASGILRTQPFIRCFRKQNLPTIMHVSTGNITYFRFPSRSFVASKYREDDNKMPVRCSGQNRDDFRGGSSSSKANLNFIQELLEKGIILFATVRAVLVYGRQKFFAAELVENAARGVVGRIILLLTNAWPKLIQVLQVFKDQGLLLAILLGLSAFFSMAETSITTLWPWKVRELAEKESEDGVFKLLQADVTRFLTTILIGTTVVNIGATVLVTNAATTIFGEAGVGAATGVMTVLTLLLTEITPKSIAVDYAIEVARIVVRPVSWLSLVLYPVGRVVNYLLMGMLKLLGCKARSEPNVTKEELKLMIRRAVSSGAIKVKEQGIIEHVLQMKETHVREVMTPLLKVVAVDVNATLTDFHRLWVINQYSRVPVFEHRIANIIGIAYAKDLLAFQKGELLESITVGDMARKPAYFVPDSMHLQSLLREFRSRKVHMAIVLNEHGVTVGIVTLEDILEELRACL